jgi:hypothetical protein
MRTSVTVIKQQLIRYKDTKAPQLFNSVFDMLKQCRKLDWRELSPCSDEKEIVPQSELQYLNIYICKNFF